MKKKIILLVLVFLLPSWFIMTAQNQAVETGRESKLVFVVEPVKTVYVKGESVEINFRLSNRSGNKVLVPKNFQLNFNVNLDILDAKGKSADWCGRIASQIDSPRSFTTLTPGESISKKLVVSCVNKDDRSRAWGYSLDAPGKYVVRGTYRLPQPKVFFKKFFPNVPVERGPVSAEPVSIEIH